MLRRRRLQSRVSETSFTSRHAQMTISLCHPWAIYSRPGSHSPSKLSNLLVPILLYSSAGSNNEGVRSSLQATYFNQNFTSTFFLHPEEAGLPLPSAAASASTGLKRNPPHIPEAQTSHDTMSSDKHPYSARVGFESEEHTDRMHHRSMGSQEAEQQQQQSLTHAVLGSHEKADEQRQEGTQRDRSPGHEEAPAQHGNAEEQAAATQMFSLDRYFLPLNKQPNSPAEHAMLHSPAQEDFLRGSPQEFRDTAIHLSSADAAGREIAEELLMTIEEQDQALR